MQRLSANKCNIYAANGSFPDPFASDSGSFEYDLSNLKTLMFATDRDVATLNFDTDVALTCFFAVARLIAT